MKLVFVLLIVAFLVSMLLSLFFSNSEQEVEEEEDLEDREGILIASVLDPREEVAAAGRDALLAMGPGVVARLQAEIRTRCMLGEAHSEETDKLLHVLADFGPRAVHAVFSLLEDEILCDELLLPARKMIGSMGKVALRPTLDALDDDTPEDLLLPLSALGIEAVDPLVEKLRDGKAVSALQNCLVDIGPVAAPALIHAAQNWREPGPRKRAMLTLARISSPDAEAFWQKASSNPDPEIKKVALHALASTENPENRALIEKALSVSEPEVRQAAIISLGELGDGNARPALKHLLHAAMADPMRTREALAAAGSLAMLGDDAGAEAIRQASSSPSGSIRRAAVATAGAFAPEARVDLLLAFCEDEQVEIAVNAIQGLGFSGSHKAAEYLGELLGRFPLGDPRLEAANHALFSLGGRARPTLLKLLQTGSPAEVETAIHAIRSLRDPRTIEPMLDVLKRGEADQQMILEFLEEMGAVAQKPIRDFVAANDEREFCRPLQELLERIKSHNRE